MRTDFDTLRALASFTLNHLAEKRIISFVIDMRTKLIEALATEYGVSFATDEDVREQAIEEVEDKLGEVNIEEVTESEMFNHAKKEIIKSFQGETLGGLYMVESLHQVAVRVKEFLLSNDMVEDVYATDEEIIDFLVVKLREFSPRRSS